MRYIYLNKYLAASSKEAYYYVGSHTWNGEGLDPNYHGSSKVAEHYGWIPIEEEIIHIVSDEDNLFTIESEFIKEYCNKYGIADCALILASNLNWVSQYKPHGLMLNLHANTMEQAYPLGLEKCLEPEVRERAAQNAYRTQKESGQFAKFQEAGRVKEVTERAFHVRLDNGAYQRWQDSLRSEEALASRNYEESIQKSVETKLKENKVHSYRRLVDVYNEDNLILEDENLTTACERLGNKNWAVYLNKKFSEGIEEVIHHGFKFVIKEQFLTVNKHKTLLDLQQEWLVDSWREFFNDEERSVNQIIEAKGYSYNTVVHYFSKSLEFVNWLKSRNDRTVLKRKRSYSDCLELCKDNNVEPLFTFDEFTGLNEIVNGKGQSKKYKVRCSCGEEYFAWFKTSNKCRRMEKCPICGRGHKDRDIVFKQVVKILKEKNLIPLFTLQTLETKADLHTVKCALCGSVFKTKLIQSKMSDCPICSLRKEKNSVDEIMNQISVKFNKAFDCDYVSEDLKVAIMFDSYTKKRDRNYNKKKTELYLNRGIKLYHLWDHLDSDLSVSIIESKLGLSKRIYARKCELREVSPKEGKQFFDFNHADGNNNSAALYVGLYYNDVLYCCISLLRRHIQSAKTDVWEIGRFATLRHFTVVGGYSKLLKYCMSYLRSLNVTELVSYCNRDLSPDPNSTFYSKSGFKFIMDSGPIYWYYTDKNILINGKEYKQGRISRQVCQKQKLIEHYNLNNIPLPSPCTEETLTEGLGLYPCYNSGNFKYVLDLINL